MEIKRLNGSKGTSTASFRSIDVTSEQKQSSAARQTQRIRVRPEQQQQSAAYQLQFSRRSFFVEDDFNDITIEELAQFMERDDDFVEEVKAETKPQEQTQPQAPEPPPDPRKVAAVDAYNWFATL